MAKPLHPPFPLLPKEGASNSKHFYTACFLEVDAARSRMQAARDRAWKATRFSAIETPHTKALKIAAAELGTMMHRHMAEAVADGELLFCWHGTRATEVPLILEGGAA